MPKSNDLVLQCLRISPPIIKSCANDLMQQALHEGYTKDITDDEFRENLMTSTFPQLGINNTSETLLVGERFEMAFKLLNKDNSDSKINSITVDLSVDKYTYRLYETDGDIIIPVDGNHVFLITHILSLPGQYNIQCSIKPSSDKSIKKLYKFTAIIPFAITSRSSLYNNTTYIQTSITNISERSLTLLDAKLDDTLSDWRIITPRNERYIQYMRPMDTFSLITSIQNNEDNLKSMELVKPPIMSKSITSDSSDVLNLNFSINLSLKWISDSKGECIFRSPLELENKSKGISFRVIKIPQRINVPAYFDAKFEIRNEGNEHMFCKILIGSLSLDETVEAPIEAGITITQTYTLHIEQTGLISLDSIRLLTWTNPPKTIKEYPLLDPPSIICF